MLDIILAYFGGFMTKFKLIVWSGYEIRLLHDKGNIRRFINMIPHFWDDEVNYTLVLRPKKNTKHYDDIWNIKWRLLDLEGNRLKEGSKDTINITNVKWMRRLFGSYWTSGKRRAVVIGNLNPNKNYILKIKFTNGVGESADKTMATFSIKDRTDFSMQIFLVLFSIVSALFFSIWFKGCGL